MAAGVVGNWIVKLPLAWVLSRRPAFLLNGVWHAMFISLVIEGAMGLIWYQRGKWMKKVGRMANN